MRFETIVPTMHKVEPVRVNSVDIIETNTDEEKQIDDLRIRLNAWKLKTMLPELSNRKNNAALYEKTNLARKLSFDLAKRIVGGEGEPQFNEVAATVLGPLGNPRTWTTDFTSKVRNAISTDLYEYPMTFEPDLITTFKNRNLPMFE